MRIMIDIDRKEINEAPNFTVDAPTLLDVINGGAPASGATTDIPDQNIGGPAAWLLEAVNLAASTEGEPMDEEISSEDAGSGPA
jgi:hypothetical protein